MGNKQDSFETHEFIERLKTRDSVCFELLYDSIGQKVFNLAYRVTGNKDDASDVTQDTFFQVYRSIDSFRGESRLSTWIYAIAKNACYRLLSRRTQSTFGSFEQMIHTVSDPNLPDEIGSTDMLDLVDQVKEGCFIGLVRCLPINQRLAFIAHVLLHLPIQDVAGMLDKSGGATKVLVHRARENLKQFLCNNCSLYNPANFCQCKNMIGFSLKQGWISYSGGYKRKCEVTDAKKIEAEVQDFRETLRFYQDVDPIDPPAALRVRIRLALQSKDWSIFPK